MVGRGWNEYRRLILQRSYVKRRAWGDKWRYSDLLTSRLVLRSKCSLATGTPTSLATKRGHQSERVEEGRQQPPLVLFLVRRVSA